MHSALVATGKTDYRQQVNLALETTSRYARLVAQPFDILVRRAAARSHRVNALLDRPKESGRGPVQCEWLSRLEH